MAIGRKTGGRKKGMPNKATARREAAIGASGETPLEYLLAVMRDPNRDGHARFEAAKAAAPYVHPRLASAAAAQRDPDFVPLAERIKEYTREEAIHASEGINRVRPGSSPYGDADGGGGA